MSSLSAVQFSPSIDADPFLHLNVEFSGRLSVLAGRRSRELSPTRPIVLLVSPDQSPLRQLAELSECRELIARLRSRLDMVRAERAFLKEQLKGPDTEHGERVIDREELRELRQDWGRLGKEIVVHVRSELARRDRLKDLIIDTVLRGISHELPEAHALHQRYARRGEVMSAGTATLGAAHSAFEALKHGACAELVDGSTCSANLSFLSLGASLLAAAEVSNFHEKLKLLSAAVRHYRDIGGDVAPIPASAHLRRCSLMIRTLAGVDLLWDLARLPDYASSVEFNNLAIVNDEVTHLRQSLVALLTPLTQTHQRLRNSLFRLAVSFVE